jgi:hypothetical protein
VVGVAWYVYVSVDAGVEGSCGAAAGGGGSRVWVAVGAADCSFGAAMD